MASKYPEFEKDPQSKVPFAIDWRDWLQGADAVLTSYWVIPQGLIQEATAINDSGLTVVLLSGGQTGRKYTLTNKITTTDGLVDERSIIVRVKER